MLFEEILIASFAFRYTDIQGWKHNDNNTVLEICNFNKIVFRFEN